MRTYHTLSKIAFLRKKFSAKFLIVAFVGIHVPLIGLIVYILCNTAHPASLLDISLLILTLTLASTTATLYVLDRLLNPLVVAKKALDNYLITGHVPDLPTEYNDEVGLLLSHIQTTIEKLDQLISEKSDMIDLLSHDLRSPIAKVIALANLIDMDKETDPSVYTGHIVNESQNLLTLLEDVLIMLRKADGNELTFHLKPVSLRSIVNKTVSFFEHSAKQKNIKFNINVEDDLIVNVEQVMFTQAIKNLLGNALKYSDEGKSIHITSIAEKRNVLLTVKDEGIGFEPKNKEKIFERFTKISRKGTSGESSTGLGLSLAKKIIEKHGGQLVANSDGLGHGATFTIMLPRNNGKIVNLKGKGLKLINRANPFKKAI